MKKEFGKWDDLVIGHSHDEMEQRKRAEHILICMKITGERYPNHIHISKNLREKDPSGFLNSVKNF